MSRILCARSNWAPIKGDGDEVEDKCESEFLRNLLTVPEGEGEERRSKRKRMRVVVTCIVLAVCLSAAAASVVSEKNPHFSLNGATRQKYRHFLRTVRDMVSEGGTFGPDNIPVLPAVNALPEDQRFVFVDLENYANKTITVPIYVVNAYVVGYVANDDNEKRLWIFNDAPEEASKVLFKMYPNHSTLDFGSTYADLGGRAGVELGPSALDSAITDLFYHNNDTIRSAFVVVIQMMSEAARFRFIEERVRRSLDKTANFQPDAAMLSLEDNWANLSSAMQHTQNGAFPAVQLQTVDNTTVTVDGITSPFVSGISLMLFVCNRPNNSNDEDDIIVMPIAQRKHLNVNFNDHNGNDDEICVLSPMTTRISGREGLCVDVTDGKEFDGDPVQLWGCGPQKNQQWTLQSDGTMQSMGKCLTANSSTPTPHTSIIIHDCDTAAKNATVWQVLEDGSIRNSASGLVLSANSAEWHAVLTVEEDTQAASQCWRVSKDVDPWVTSIIGYHGLCMQANQDSTQMWLQECVQAEQKQLWALYGDGTIRVDEDRRLCLMADGLSSVSLIVIQPCNGSVTERWHFRTDGFIQNPGSGYVVDVRKSNVSLHQVILFPQKKAGFANQLWLPFF